MSDCVLGMNDWISIADVSECPPGVSIERLAGGRMVAIANVDGTFHAIDGLCPHQGGPLGTGVAHPQIPEPEHGLGPLR